MELSLHESMISRGSNKELAKSQITSITSSTKKLLLETKLKAKIELNECEQKIQQKVKLRHKRELRDRNTEDLVHEEHNLSVTEKVNNLLTENKRQVKDENIAVNNFDLKQLLMRQSINKDLPIFLMKLGNEKTYISNSKPPHKC
ncbi:hypothetical protein FQA39_LY01174 [Lamprigera yunnana]|nr:hypothetical protein FQA39_LY01174 [Lamprigera yunnana]